MAELSYVGNANVSSVQSTFARKETKYVLSQTQYSCFMDRIGDVLEEEPFGRSAISSLYYDTKTFELINRSMEKPRYKEKLRIRSYGEYRPDAAVFAELKTKFKGIVYKRRVQLSEKAAYLFMNGKPYEQAQLEFPLAAEKRTIHHSAQVDTQIAREIEACVARHPGLRPAMMVIVDRLPLHTTDGSGVRITYDFNARYRTDELAFSRGLHGEPIMPNDEVILEIKCQGAYPLWLVRALNEVKAYARPCSKYAMAYEISHPRCAKQAVPSARLVADELASGFAPLFTVGSRACYTA